MATIDGKPISVPENLMMQEIASIFKLRIKIADLDNDIVELERETGLAGYDGLKAVRARLEDRRRVCKTQTASNQANSYEAQERVSERSSSSARRDCESNQRI